MKNWNEWGGVRQRAVAVMGAIALFSAMCVVLGVAGRFGGGLSEVEQYPCQANCVQNCQVCERTTYPGPLAGFVEWMDLSVLLLVSSVLIGVAISRGR